MKAMYGLAVREQAPVVPLRAVHLALVNTCPSSVLSAVHQTWLDTKTYYCSVSVRMPLFLYS
jgi:hypothetical protein